MASESDRQQIANSRVVRKAARSIGLGRVGVEVSGLVSSIALARILGPRAFGVTLAGFFVITIATTLKDQAITQTLVARRTADRAHYEAAQFLALFGSMTLGGLVLVPAIILAPGLNHVFGHGAALLIAVSSASFPIGASGAVFVAQHQRALQFRTLARSDALGALIGAAAVIAGALAGLQGLSIIAGGLITLLVSVIVVSRGAEWYPPKWHPAAIKRLIGNSAAASSNSLIYATFQNADYLLINVLFSPFVGGLYWRAFQLGIDYQAKVTTVMQQVAFPVYSRVEPDERSRIRARVVGLHAAVLLPVLAILCGAAHDVIFVFYGPRWSGAVPLLRLIALGGVGVTLAAGLGPLLMALGRAGALATWAAVQLAMLVGAIFAAKAFGIVATTAAIAGVHLLGAAISNYFLGQRIAGVSLRSLGKDLKGPCIGAVAAACVAFVLEQVTSGVTGIWTAGALVCVVAGSMLTYMSALWILAPTEFAALRSFLKSRSPAPAS